MNFFFVLFLKDGGTQDQPPTPSLRNGCELELSDLMDEVAAQIPSGIPLE